MVAISGTGWRLARSLVVLVEETDRLAPRRSKTSDGSIGDTAHAARTSDHNPDGGWVCAVDITDDKANGCDADLLARHIVASRDPRVKYVIWNRTIAKSYPSNGVPAWQPYPYTGTNPHDSHTHISIHNTEAARDDVRPWWPQSQPPPTPQPEDPDMALIVRGNDSSRPARLLAGPVASLLSKADRESLEKKGVVSEVLDDSSYDAMKAQLDKLFR